MRAVMLAATAVVLAVPAYAGVINVSVTDDGNIVPLVCAGGVNSPITCQGGSVHFASINVGAVGASNASLASITIAASSAATFTGSHVLGIDVLQDQLAVTTSGTATSTFTVNNLTGGPFGPSTLSTAVNGVQLASHTFPATTTNDTAISTDAIPLFVTSDAHSYALTFTAADQAATDTIQLTVGQVPEPLGLAVLGSGLLGLAVVRRRA